MDHIGELRIWLAGGERLTRGFEPLCVLDVLRPHDWESAAKSRPHFLLVETAGPWALEEKQLARLLEYCEAAGVPALLWATSSPLVPHWFNYCGRFSVVFSVDRALLPSLEAAGANARPMWPGVGPPGPPPSIPGAGVLWLGGWRRDWPAPWRERLTSVLRGAARRDLRILPSAAVEALPADLCRFVQPADPGVGRSDLLQSARIIFGADPLFGSSTLAPTIAFEAAAAGVAVITPHDFLGYHEFAVGGMGEAGWRNLIPIVHDGDSAITEIDRLFDDDFHGEVIDHLSRIVANNHTHAHRLATLASAVGCRLMPNVGGSTASG